MDLAGAWLEWLVQGVGYELMLFAAVGILVFGIDDLMVDLAWFATRRRPTSDRSPSQGDLAGPIAIFVPAWREEAVLPATLAHMLASWDGDDFRLYVGCYPNDAATLFAISRLVADDRRLRLVIGDADGPTTKGDNLNRLWAALCEDERAEDMRFSAIALHDAEDQVHRAELDLYRRHLGGHAMVQIPVVPLSRAGQHWVSGHYGDEFAESHGKELPLRSRLGLPLPSAGVGCALTRNALALLAIERDGRPFRADSLAEDYEVGMLLSAFGLATQFVDARDARGERIASRGEFPGEMEAAIRQKSRWIVGIALAGWQYLDWPGVRAGAGYRAAAHGWAARWMLWRDRRAPLSATITLAAYVGALFGAIGVVGEWALGWHPPVVTDGVRMLLAIDGALLLWRLAMRFHFAARWYGPRAALAALPRAFVANIIAILAARRAVVAYWTMLRSGRVVWEKTDHGPATVEKPQAVRLAAR